MKRFLHLMHDMREIIWFWILFAELFIGLVHTEAQHTVQGLILDSTGKGLHNATVLFMSKDTLAGATVTNNKRAFILRELPSGDYTLVCSMLGYKQVERKTSVSANLLLPAIYLEENPVTLQDVTVQADRSRIVQTTAGSNTFFISEPMKSKARSIFEALQEVPLLSVDIANRSIKTLDGKDPLILINGVKRDDVLLALDPENIEAVEVIENPSARYLGEEGGAKVVNLRMKRSVQTAQTVNLFSTQTLNGIFGYYQGAYGMEKEKTSLFINMHYWYNHRIKSDVEDHTSTGTFVRDLSGYRQTGGHSFYVGGNGDWVLSGTDYVSYGFSLITNPSNTHTQEEGMAMEKGVQAPLKVKYKSKSTYLTGNYNLFYRHTYASDRYLEMTGIFGHHKSGPEGWRTEKSELYTYWNSIDMDNVKQYAKAEVNYDFPVGDRFAMSVGSNTYYQHINLKDSEVNFPYSESREYLYVNLKNKHQKRLGYMFSVGLDLVFRNAGHVKKIIRLYYLHCRCLTRLMNRVPSS